MPSERKVSSRHLAVGASPRGKASFSLQPLLLTEEPGGDPPARARKAQRGRPGALVPSDSQAPAPSGPGDSVGDAELASLARRTGAHAEEDGAARTEAARHAARTAQDRRHGGPVWTVGAALRSSRRAPPASCEPRFQSAPGPGLENTGPYPGASHMRAWPRASPSSGPRAGDLAELLVTGCAERLPSRSRR